MNVLFIGGWPHQIASVGDYLYVGDRISNTESVLHIVDVSDPAAPLVAGSYSTLGYIKDIGTVGNYLFIANSQEIYPAVENMGLQILDVTSPTDPVEVAFYRGLLQVDNLVIDSNFVHLETADIFTSEPDAIRSFWFAPAATAVFTPGSGVRLSSPLDKTVYTFPASAFTDTATITHTARYPADVPSPAQLVPISHFFETQASSEAASGWDALSPGQSYTLTVHYREDELGPAIESTLGLYYWDGTQWRRETSSAVDTVANTVTGTPQRLGIWGILAEAKRVYMPLLSRDIGDQTVPLSAP